MWQWLLGPSVVYEKVKLGKEKLINLWKEVLIQLNNLNKDGLRN